MNELRMPPRRPLPPEVRSRIRTRVLTGLDQPHRRFLNSRAPFAVAAGVAVLAAGAMIVGQSVHGGAGDPGKRQTPPTGSATARPLDLRVANAELDRCWAAIQADGKADRYPDRSRWRAVTADGDLWVRVTAAFADGKPIFCQTSLTTVRVSEPTATPAFVAGSKTAALLMTPEGIIAGIRDESWPGVGTFVGDDGGNAGSQADLLPYGLFVASARTRITDTTKAEVDRWANDRDRAEHPERFTLPRPAVPVSRVDRPAPPADRTSDRGQWLKQCLDRSEGPVVDADMWEPGAWATAGDARYMVLRAGQSFAYCFTDKIPSKPDGVPDTPRWGFGTMNMGRNDFGKDRPEVLAGMTQLGSPTTFLLGALPSSVNSLDVVRGDRPPVKSDVWNSTFAVVLPVSSQGTHDTARAFDAAGNKIFETEIS
jgi:hypothetical protein